MSDLERLMTPEQTAAWLRERGKKISETTVRRELVAGTIPGRRIGRAWMTSVAELRAWLGFADPPPTPAAPAVPNVTDFLVSKERRSA